jgi:hypothetical protein
VSGYVAVTVDALPNAPASPVELRARLFAERTLRPSELITLHASGFVEGLTADREGGQQDAFADVQEANIELAWPRADLLAGYSRIVWGRLDEVQPSDVINPLDLAKYLLEGRAEARLAVALVRGRLFFGERATIEGVIVPVFRRGRFDRLDEETSPFNLTANVPARGDQPPPSFDNVQGGARVSLTAGRTDWSMAVFRGFRTFPAYEQLPFDPLVAPAVIPVRELFPRYTMLAADFETATAEWSWRAEAAAFFEDDCAAPSCGETSFDGGLGFDRRAGSYHLSASVLVRRATVAPDGLPSAFRQTDGVASAFKRTTTTVVAAADRSFAQERYRTRAFVVYNVKDAALFLRNITTVKVADHVALEGSAGWFAGEGNDLLARFGDSDFVYARVKVHF